VKRDKKSAVKKSAVKKSAARKTVAKKSYASSSVLSVHDSVARKPTLIHMNAQGRVTLPASARRSLGLEGDADLQLDVDHRAIVLRPTVVVPVEDAWAYTALHRELLKRGHADSRAGRVRSLRESELDSALSGAGHPQIESLRDEFDALLARMQTPKARRAMTAAFSASPKQMGRAAVALAAKRGN